MWTPWRWFEEAVLAEAGSPAGRSCLGSKSGAEQGVLIAAQVWKKTVASSP